MSYSAKDYEFLGKQVAAGKYVARSTFLLSVLLALVLGGIAGNLTASPGSLGFTTGEEQRPLGAAGSALTQNKDKETTAAILQHEQEAVKNPNNVENWEHLGNLYYDTNEPDKAIKAYEKALALKPNNVSVIVDCGVMYREKKDFAKALEFFRKARSIDPKHEIAHFNEGVVLYYDLDKKDEGLAMWKKLIELNPQAKTPSGALIKDMLKDLGAR